MPDQDAGSLPTPIATLVAELAARGFAGLEVERGSMGTIRVDGERNGLAVSMECDRGHPEWGVHLSVPESAAAHAADLVAAAADDLPQLLERLPLRDQVDVLLERLEEFDQLLRDREFRFKVYALELEWGRREFGEDWYRAMWDYYQESP